MQYEDQHQARLAREASETFLGTLGDRSGVNVARVEVSWFVEYDDGTEEHAGHYAVHARGDEPEAETIYDTFESLTHDAMEAKQVAGRIDGYMIDDVLSW